MEPDSAQLCVPRGSSSVMLIMQDNYSCLSLTLLCNLNLKTKNLLP